MDPIATPHHRHPRQQRIVRSPLTPVPTIAFETGKRNGRKARVEAPIWTLCETIYFVNLKALVITLNGFRVAESFKGRSQL